MSDEAWLLKYAELIELAKDLKNLYESILRNGLCELEQPEAVQQAIMAFHAWVAKTQSVQAFEHMTVRAEWSLSKELDGGVGASSRRAVSGN